MFRTDRLERPGSRRALMVAGVATIAFSLIVAIAPAMAARGGNGNGNNSDNGNGNGNAGVAQVHDATTDLEAPVSGNEPWVCTFWVGFYASNPTEAGTWQIVSWPPTGDGTVVASGSYDTAGDGFDQTSDLSVAEGHYRLTWQTASDPNAKQKTFWVECEGTESNSDPTDEAAPSDAAAPTDEESPTEEATPTGQATPTEEAAPSGEESVLGEEQTPPTDESEPSGEAAPTDEASPAEENPDATDEAAPTPEEGILAGNPNPVASPEAPEGDAAPAGNGATELPDTSLPVQPSGVLATIGVLLIIAAHVGTRRARLLPAA